ncbi:hypothetical protein L207DRAFT_576653 [Hyaloscypha variabilis F]|uniref:Uncharacterized protein n=1 Tax=Hyaloscypha variabilis (strain UAMH 11265 / GT02V1 / F) TaxID=1149755 RepID=A0A2J6SAW9_HYAVF|nr:hypothetical protein L207DRAFT_576653 [Hyaloscypha variabilis F]
MDDSAALRGKSTFGGPWSSNTDSWYELVKRYSALALSHPEKDRLIAISGIAREVQSMLVMSTPSQPKPKQNLPRFQEYVSGFWLHDLPRRLSWQVTNPSEAKFAGNNGPSWSWATYNSPVFWPGFVGPAKQGGVGDEYFVHISPTLREDNPSGSRRKLKSKIIGPVGTSILQSSRMRSATEITSMVAAFPTGIEPSQTMTFVMKLQLSGRLQRISKSSTCLSATQIRVFEKACGFPPEDWLVGSRGVYKDDPLDLIGWGSFEEDGSLIEGSEACPQRSTVNERPADGEVEVVDNERVQTQSSEPSNVSKDIYCFLLSSYLMPGGLQYGYILGFKHKVYEVLYLRIIGGEYKRIGSGRILERRFFKGCEEVNVTLV